MKETIIRITTADTKKTYEYPNENSPQLWEVKLSIEALEESGKYSRYSSTTVHGNPTVKVYLEKETLLKAGLLPWLREKNPDIQQEETVEDLLIRLLEHVGVYPSE